MSFSRCVMIGSGVGFCTGIVGSAYFMGESQKYNDRDSILDAIGELLSTGASLAAPVGGVVGGAVLGGGYFATKNAVTRLSSLPPQARMVSAAIAATGLVATCAYNVGKKQ
ncbi:MAG: hypothetical protein JSR37_03630 [Verrucomicrobia bacterium]|nr:hypothetical protein [Verrucomicrobiota bacterium]